jgi:hypothetical protein
MEQTQLPAAPPTRPAVRVNVLGWVLVPACITGAAAATAVYYVIDAYTPRFEPRSLFRDFESAFRFITVYGAGVGIAVGALAAIVRLVVTRPAGFLFWGFWATFLGAVAGGVFAVGGGIASLVAVRTWGGQFSPELVVGASWAVTGAIGGAVSAGLKLIIEGTRDRDRGNPVPFDGQQRGGTP